VTPCSLVDRQDRRRFGSIIVKMEVAIFVRNVGRYIPEDLNLNFSYVFDVQVTVHRDKFL